MSAVLHAIRWYKKNKAESITILLHKTLILCTGMAAISKEGHWPVKKVQKRATRLMTKDRSLSYEERLQRLGLTILCHWIQEDYEETKVGSWLQRLGLTILCHWIQEDYEETKVGSYHLMSLDTRRLRGDLTDVFPLRQIPDLDVTN